MSKEIEKRVEKLEDQQKVFIEDIAIIKTEINVIKTDSAEIKITVKDIQTELIAKEKESLEEFHKIHEKFAITISDFKDDMNEILEKKISGHRVDEKKVEELEQFKTDHEKLHENISGEFKGMKKLLHYIWAPFVIVLYIVWDKFISRIIHKFFP